MKIYFTGLIKILILLVLSACSFQANVQVLVPEEVTNKNKPKIYLQSEYFAQDTVLNLTAIDCDNSDQLFITENLTLIPLATDNGWINCQTTVGGITYQLNDTSLGAHTIYIWGKDSKNKISESAKIINLKYSPRILLGQNNPNENIGLKVGLGTPTAIKKIGTKFYVVNRDMASIAVYNSMPTSSLQEPDYSIGKIYNNYSGAHSVGPKKLYNPYYIDSDGTRLAVVDTFNHRILIWNTIPTNATTDADVVVGQADFYSNGLNAGKGQNTELLTCADLNYPRDVKFYNGKMIISDYENNRVLIWNSIPTTNYVAADIVLGQQNCSTNSKGTVSPTTMWRPYDTLVFPGSPDKFLITDSNNNRVLIYNSFPTVSGQAADMVLGQSLMTTATGNSGGLSMSSLAYPFRMATDGTKLIVSDLNNSRILVWNTFPTVNKQAADVVLGQTSGTTSSANQGGPASASTMNGPSGMDIIDGNLWLADANNNRVLKYNGIPSSNGEAATFVLGQASADRQITSFNGGVNQTTYNRVYDVDVFNNEMYIAEFGSNRILKFNSIPTQNNQIPDLIYGQDGVNDMQSRRGSTTTDGRNFSDPSAVLNVLVNGQQKTIISDASQNRVLIYNDGIADDNDMADLVLGQPDFATRTANTNGISKSSIYLPQQVASDGNYLVVSDYSNNRVLIWNSFPTSNNQPADVVLGQPSASSNTANNGGLSASSMSGPRGVAIVNQKLIVSDSENARILIWNSIPTTDGQAADEVIGQKDFVSFETTINDASVFLIKPGFLQFINNQFVAVDLYSNRVNIWEGLPTQTDQFPDKTLGGHFNPGQKDTSPMPMNFNLNALTYSAKIVGQQVFISDYSGYRLLIREIPEVSNLGPYSSNSRNVLLTVHNCARRSKVMFNEGSQPLSSDSNWQTCSTQKNHFQYTVSSGDAVKQIKVWFKDDEGLVLPQPHHVYFHLNTNAHLIKGIALSTTSPTNSTTIQFTSAGYKNDSMNSLVKFYVSESNVAPTAIDNQWTQLAATNSYTLSNTTSETKSIYIWGADSAGNMTAYPTKILITFDNQPPMNAPTATLTGHFLSNLSPTYRFTMNNCSDARWIMVNEGAQPLASDTAWQSCSTAANAISYVPLIHTFGVRQFQIWSKDAAGNVSLNPSVVSAEYQQVLAVGHSAIDVNDYTATMFSELRSIESNGSKFIITDHKNSRVLIYDGDPISNTPSVVLGQTALTKIGCNNGGVTAATLCYPTDAIFAGSKIIVVDSQNHRVLIWNSIPTTNGVAADVVIGQQNFTSNNLNLNGSTKSCSGLYGPSGVWSDGTKLTIGDYNNNRILIFNTIPTTNYTAADIVVGQTNCSNNTGGTTDTIIKTPHKAIIADNKFIVSDRGNNRILIYNSVPTSHGAVADVVIGQIDMTSSGFAVLSTALRNPNHIKYVDNKLYVADINNGRLLVYNSIPTANGVDADVVIGKSSMTALSPTSGLNGFTYIFGFYVDSQYLWAADISNFKIKRFNLPLTTGASATTYVGGYDATVVANSRITMTTTASQMTMPLASIIVGTKLIVADYSSNRVLIWNTLPTTSGQAADVVLGQPDFTSTTANNTAITDAGARMNKPFGLFSNGTNLYVADMGNNRVLVFNTIPTTNAASPSFILGQANSTTLSANRGGSPGLGTMSGPTRIYANDDRLYVTDSNNHRVLIWTTLPTTTGASANYVIGQTTVSANTSAAAQNRLNNPQSVVEYNGKIIVADTSNHRIMVWNSVPTAHGANADLVIGQTTFTASGSALTSTGFNAPRTARMIGDKLFVADQQNNRIMVWNNLPTTTGVAADHIIGQSSAGKNFENFSGISGIGFYFPYDINYDGEYYWINESYNHRVVKVKLPL